MSYIEIEWEETIPNSNKIRYLFQDQIFAVKVGRSKNIKISVSLSKDDPNVHCKAIEGLELLSGQFNLRLESTIKLDQRKFRNIWTSEDSLEKLKSGIEMRYHHKEFIFYQNLGKKVTYNWSIEIEVEKENSASENYLKLHELLFMKKELSDVKLICEEKIFECHKNVLSCRSEVFEAMFKSGTKMVESESGEVKIDDVKADTLETMIYFMYHDKVSDEKKIKADLLFLAEMYNIQPLSAVCVKYLEENLSVENALDVLVAANLINKEDLLDAATQFVLENRGNLAKTDVWNELSENDHLMNKIMKAMLKLE